MMPEYQTNSSTIYISCLLYTSPSPRDYGIVISVQFHIRASFLFLRCKNEGKLLRGDVKEVTIVCRLVGFDAVENKWIEY